MINWTLYVVRNFQACISVLWTGLAENCKHLAYEKWGSDKILHLTLWCMCIFRPGNGKRNKTVISVSWKIARLFNYLPYESQENNSSFHRNSEREKRWFSNFSCKSLCVDAPTLMIWNTGRGFFGCEFDLSLY